MDPRLPQVAGQLLQIEADLRRLGWWSQSSPGADALASQAPFCVDTLDFAEWLQWVFLPRMHLIIEQDLPLPSTSGICEMAEVRFSDQLREVRQLLESLRAFDRLIGG
jgi:uncharacterized protein YqcC (DUF446 family)